MSIQPVDAILNQSNVASDRLVLFPIKYNDIWQMYKKALAAMWTAEEVDFVTDIEQWENRLTDDEKYYIKHILAFFASADGIVNENLVERFMSEIQAPEARCFYGFQVAMENIHCVRGDTLVLTDKGYIEIGRHVDKSFNVWNGHEWSNVQFKQTSQDAELTTVKLSNGMKLDCTSEHKWFIRNDDSEGSQPSIVFTKDLRIGQQLHDWKYPVLSGTARRMDNAYTFGFAFGSNRSSAIPVRSSDLEHLDFDVCERRGSQYLCRIRRRYTENRSYVPYNHDLNTRLQWLSGLWSACSVFEGGRCVFRIESNKLARHVQLLISTLGAFSLQTNKNVSIGKASAKQLIEVGVKLPKHFEESYAKMDEGNDDKVFVSGLSTAGRSKTFCFSEPLRHSGCFAGIVTGQSETYSSMIDTYIRDPEERQRLFHSIENIPVIRKKADWSMKWIGDHNSKKQDVDGFLDLVKRLSKNAPSLVARVFEVHEQGVTDVAKIEDIVVSNRPILDEDKSDASHSQASFGERLLAFACVEGIFFSGSFAAIFWLKKRGLMPGLAFANDKIAADEGLHQMFACMLYKNYLKHQKPTVERAHQIVREAVELEKEFQTEALPVSLIQLNCEQMKQYIEFVADQLLVMAGLPKIYLSNNPFEFMINLSLSSSTNFFEKHNPNYQKLQGPRVFNLNTDF